MIAGIQVKLRHFMQQAVSKLARTTGFPRIVADKTEPVLGEPFFSKADPKPAGADQALFSSPEIRQSLKPPLVDDQGNPRPSIHAQLERFSDMNTSVDTLAEQMLTLVEIVSAQERDIKALKEQCRVLEEHDQAIAVAFSTFFHVLSAGRVAKLSEIATILHHIIEVAEQEGRPAASIKFLQDLAGMLPEEHR
ncbi:hypothetical protein VB618_13100 [Microvirga sp. CF3062]|uniref:hypothetical protein n=1 Tax=Microvirga sp. CF3062 TaxID=3110182 RepID=UPI002E7A599B|nr:hypothetical protein [Microvirga sp. CF3062]MEE1657139.1 hypothetical protein [Microvirga sp. CF3062]